MDTAKFAKSSGQKANSASAESSDAEETEESSSSQTQNEAVLANFRDKWQKELRVSPIRKNPTNTSNKHEIKKPDEQFDDFEKKARMLFQKGADLEKAGNLYEAIQFYRRAVQIVPDIEFRLDNTSKTKTVLRERTVTDGSEDETEEDSENSSSDDNSDDEEIKKDELLPRIQRKCARLSTLCIPKFEQKASLHISALPVEIILLILRWLVSSDLDLRSLEMFSTVCRGFYLCGRDPEIWRLACFRVWGLNCGISPGDYGSWREMFIGRARINFHGCYISKTTYIRHGENSFQDQFYRPWHLIAYYRYLRFFPEGLVLMLTSSDEPSQCVGQMKYRNARNPVMSGYYRLKDDKITLVVQRQDSKVPQAFKKNKRKEVLHENAEQTFHMELQITNNFKKKHVQLVWTHYSVFTRNKKGDESTCNFDLVTNKFPPLWFSRVKSFTSESEAPLQ